ncbi:hypothetical protein D0T53_03465 [Dysgonomonas sp. 216]|uniref:hypothetical protein n=1 Tax=Dysgonomonas sp. 216 TaxID=2302934 RepID=UPI0013D60EBB|nr:hypothetical protein [Dysgonomonas sp. 216]NDW17975.1 hypothetical protein [Dysgonomonas sp. 216]
MKAPCEDFTAFETFILRSQGYMSSQELIPYWATSSGNHLISSVFCDSLNKMISLETIETYKDTFPEKQFTREPSKVIRFTYSKQPEVLAVQEAPENIPNNFLRLLNYKDVTEEYWPTGDLSCQLFSMSADQIAYACVLNYQFWQPTWWGRANTGNVLFSNMTKGVVYLPAYYNEGKIVPAGDPVAFGYNNIQVLKPDTLNLRSVVVEEQEKYLKFRPFKQYKLFYWDKEWILIAEKTTGESTKELVYDQVPQNALLLLIPEYSQRKERPFIITEEKQRVWF